MGKKKLSSIFKGGAGGLLSVPLCYNAKTLSFRVGDDMIKTVNSVFFDHHNGVDLLDEAKTPESWFTNSSETASHSTESDQDLDAESLEMVVRGVVRSERLFFDPGVPSSILEEIDSKSKEKLKSKKVKGDDRDCSVYSYNNPAMESEVSYGDLRRLDCDLKSKKVVTVRDGRDCGVYSYNNPPIEEISLAVAMESEVLDCDLKSKKVVTVRDGGVYSYSPPIEEISVAVAMESEDPYGDFRRSMEEMVTNHGELAKDWESLESMLAWYLKMNERKSHSVIISAFVDLVSGISDSVAGSSSACYSTAVSSFPSSPVNSLSQGQTEIEEEERRSC